MRYPSILFILLVFFANISKAQITFTSDEVIASFSQQSNQTNYLPESLNGLQALVDQSGPSQTWDFSSITWAKDTAMSNTTSTFFQYPGDAAMAGDSDFIGSTHVEKNITLGSPTLYDFYKIDQTGFFILGESQSDNGADSKILSFNPPFQELKLPLTYQTSWNGASKVNDSQMPSGMTSSEKIDGIVDGYGTLVLPGSINDCLRLKYKITAIVNYLGTAMEFYEYEFLWITSNGVAAVIDADSNQHVTSTTSPNNPSPQPTRYNSQGASSVGNNSLSSDLLSDIHLSQNPASSATTLFFNLRVSGNVQVSLMDALGREVHILQNTYVEAGQNVIKIDPSKLATGSYFIRVNAEGISATKRLIITK